MKTLLLSLLALLPLSSMAADNLALPDIGDHSTSVLSAEQQKRIGESVMRSIRRSGKLLGDREAEAYLADLGHRLAAEGDFPRSGLTFFIVNDPSINAFALPGGFIGIHTGLVMAARNEAELASVVAHEISHVTQNHLARGLEKAERMNLPVMAALLTAVVLGADDPEVAEAAIATAAAGSTQMQLNFTRRHEKEADRIGMQLLSGSGLDPGAMPAFFERLQQDSRFRSNAAPEFLRTHPVTSSRISDSRNRAAQMKGGSSEFEPYRFELIEAKLRVLTLANPEAELRRLEASDTDSGGPVATYERALLLRRQGRYEEAIRLLKGLHEADGSRIAFALALAETTRAAARYAEAASVYERMLEFYPGNTLLTIGYAETLVDGGHPARARGLLANLVRNSERTVTPDVYRLLAEAENARGEAAASHLALARYHRALGEIAPALTQIELAKRQDLDYYEKLQVEALERELKRMEEGESGEPPPE